MRLNLSSLLTPRWLGLLGLAGLMALATLPALRPWLAFDAQCWSSGHWWRPLTAWLTQVNYFHGVINGWGLVVLAIVLPDRPPRSLAWDALAIFLGSSVLLVLSDYQHYAGLSGVLYGWLVYAIARSPFYSLGLRLLVVAIISGKVIIENIPEIAAWLPDSAWLEGRLNAEIAVESHAWGLFMGWLMLGFRAVAERVVRNTEPPH